MEDKELKAEFKKLHERFDEVDRQLAQHTQLLKYLNHLEKGLQTLQSVLLGIRSRIR